MPPEQRITACAHLMATGARVGDVDTDGADNLAIACTTMSVRLTLLDHADGRDRGWSCMRSAAQIADAGAQEVNVDAALAAVAGRLDLVDLAVVAGAPSRPSSRPARGCAAGYLRTAAPRGFRCRARVRLRAYPGDAARGLSGSASPSAEAQVICAMMVAPPRPTTFLSSRSTLAPVARRRRRAANMPAPPPPTTRTSVFERADVVHRNPPAFGAWPAPALAECAAA